MTRMITANPPACNPGLPPPRRVVTLPPVAVRHAALGLSWRHANDSIAIVTTLRWTLWSERHASSLATQCWTLQKWKNSTRQSPALA